MCSSYATLPGVRRPIQVPPDTFGFPRSNESLGAAVIRALDKPSFPLIGTQQPHTNERTSIGTPHKHKLVASITLAGNEIRKTESPIAIKTEHGFWGGDLERPATNPVHDVPPG